MAEHSALTGSSLHESKGVSTATAGQVAVASGSGTAPFGTLVNGSIPTGMPIQITETTYATLNTVTATIPVDNTVPQNTEGEELFTHSHTPKSATNILSIEVLVHGSSTGSPAEWSIALFQDAIAAALAAAGNHQNSGTIGSGTETIALRHKMVAGGTSAITFKVHAGDSGSNTVTINGNGGSRLYGGVLACSIRIIEYKA
jgi:hypothetical protein